MELTTVWFILIAVLWIGYFTLEGFDFGVGMLLPVLARDDTERRVMINTIGPVWDGNEVWVLVAGGATFAAFPEWYATLFSGFYLPLLLILVALIVRGLAFEYRHKRDEAHWTARWDLALIVGSFVPAVLWGVAFANIVHGVPIDADKEFTGNLFTLLNPFGLLGGLVTLTLFLTHGAMFVALKTDGEIRQRARDAVGAAGDGRRGGRGGVPGVGADRHREPRLRTCCSCWPRSPWSQAPTWLTSDGRAGPSSAPSRPSRWPWPGCSWRCSPTSCRPRSPTGSR